MKVTKALLQQTDIIIEKFVADMEEMHMRIRHLGVINNDVETHQEPSEEQQILALQATLVSTLKGSVFTNPKERTALALPAAAATLGTLDVTRSALALPAAAATLGTLGVTRSALALPAAFEVTLVVTKTAFAESVVDTRTPAPRAVSDTCFILRGFVTYRQAYNFRSSHTKQASEPIGRC